MTHCLTMWGPGPPGYAMGCKLERGHDGEHDMPTPEECRDEWNAGMRRSCCARRYFTEATTYICATCNAKVGFRRVEEHMQLAHGVDPDVTVTITGDAWSGGPA